MTRGAWKGPFYMLGVRQVCLQALQLDGEKRFRAVEASSGNSLLSQDLSMQQRQRCTFR
jgi:hypothetical protein